MRISERAVSLLRVGATALCLALLPAVHATTPTTTVVSASPSASPAIGQTVTLTATVYPHGTNPTPTWNVQFLHRRKHASFIHVRERCANQSGDGERDL